VSPGRSGGGPRKGGPGGRGGAGGAGGAGGRSRPGGGGGRAGRSGPAAGRSGTPGRPARGGSGQRGSTPVRAREGRPSGLGGDQVEGRQAVRELLLAGRRRVREVLLASGMDAAPILEDIVDLADEQKVTIREVSRGKFESLARTDAPQGVLAFAAPLPELDLHDVLESPDGRPPFLLLLDGLTDPGNVGAILRSAECAGVTGVVFPRHRAARVTPTVAKAAAGAVEHLRLATVPGLPTALRILHERGVWSVGLDASGPTSLYDVELADAGVALVLGAEGSGLSRLVRERCDVLAHIPMAGTLGSMNAASAAAVALFEVARRR
jgi:23S rRNA (guanosine2251-2'-O)-methyltransferase